MKVLFSLLLTIGMATHAVAQGKVRLVNDSLHLVYWDPASGSTNAGLAYLSGQYGITLTIELWSGTSSTALSRVAVTDFAGQSSPGTWAGMNVTLPTAAGPTFFQIDIYDVAAGSWQVATTTPGYVAATSGLFAAVSSSVAAYFSLVQHTSPALSTWADGNYNLDSISPGFRGAIVLFPPGSTPEPSTFALSCLGLAMLLRCRCAERRRIQK